MPWGLSCFLVGVVGIVAEIKSGAGGGRGPGNRAGGLFCQSARGCGSGRGNDVRTINSLRVIIKVI